MLSADAVHCSADDPESHPGECIRLLALSPSLLLLAHGWRQPTHFRRLANDVLERREAGESYSDCAVGRVGWASMPQVFDA